MPTVLDLFCCAGGASMGYHLAGFDVVGVDIDRQPHYPFEFHQADALEFPLDGFDFIHASPPCQGYSKFIGMHDKDWPILVDDVRERLQASGMPWVIENIPQARLRDPILLCGSMFELRIAAGDLRRHRHFECSLPLPQMECRHRPGIPSVGVYGHGGTIGRHRMLSADEKREIMQTPWMKPRRMQRGHPTGLHQVAGRASVATAPVAAQTAGGRATIA
jgi:DNA (cytosine-5)-methyltransferase 1